MRFLLGRAGEACLVSPFLILGLCLVLSSCTDPIVTESSTIRIALINRPRNGLVCLGAALHAKSGSLPRWKLIHVETGDLAVRALSEGQAEIAISAPPPFFDFALENPAAVDDIQILAGINNVQNSFVVATKSTSGIAQSRDLRGKKLGHLGTSTDFFTTYFLITEGINTSQITQIVFPSIERLLEALGSGEVDAVVVPDRTLRQADTQNLNVFYSSVHELSSQVLVKRATIEKSPELIRSFLESLISAEKVLYTNASTAVSILKTCFEETQDQVFLDLILRHELRVLLDESLRAQYLMYKKWMIARPSNRKKLKRVREFSVNYFFNADPLKAIDYKRVLIK